MPVYNKEVSSSLVTSFNVSENKLFVVRIVDTAGNVSYNHIRINCIDNAMKSNHVIISLAGHLVCPRTCSRLQVTDETSAFGGFGGGVNGVLLGDKDVLFSICTKLRCQHGKYTGRPCICGVLGERTN